MGNLKVSVWSCMQATLNCGQSEKHACLVLLSDICLFCAAGNSGNAFDFVQFNCSQMHVDCSNLGES